jgi:hypothetical protein
MRAFQLVAWQKPPIRSLDAKALDHKNAVSSAAAHLGQIEQIRLLMSLQLAFG